MKLNAISTSGQRIKDFIDIYFLLKRFSLNEMLQLYLEKYEDASLFLVLKSLNYFKDAESDKEPFLFKPVKWSEVKSTINKELDRYIKEND